MNHTVAVLFKTFRGLGFADKFFQGFHRMTVLFLETIYAGLLSHLRPPTDILDRTCIFGPKITLAGMVLR